MIMSLISQHSIPMSACWVLVNICKLCNLANFGLQCPVGSYNEGNNQQECTQCPFGFSTEDDEDLQTTINDCQVAPGYQLNADNNPDTIEECPLGKMVPQQQQKHLMMMLYVLAMLHQQLPNSAHRVVQQFHQVTKTAHQVVERTHQVV